MSLPKEVGRVVGTLAAAKLIVDALCDTLAPCTGSDVLTDQEFETLMAMSDRLDRTMTDLASRR